MIRGNGIGQLLAEGEMLRKEFAQLVGVSPRTISNWVAAGLLKPVQRQFGRLTVNIYTATDLDAAKRLIGGEDVYDRSAADAG